MTTRTVRFARWRKFIFAVAATLSCAITYAQPQPAAPDADPPIRVARMSYVAGTVSFSPAGNDQWVDAHINRPVVAGDRLWADRDGRAELTLDNSTWWLGSDTDVTVSNLDDRIVQMQLTQGALDLRVRQIPSGNIVEVDTPNLAFALTQPGRYRVEVDPQGDATSVAVVAGGGEAYGESASYAVAAGEAIRFHGTDLRDSERVALARSDPFDRFVDERDHRYDNVVAARYVSPEVVGYEDLDAYGTWTAEASYGEVWFPRGVSVGWAPYREGHWAWIDPWGWTWVDDAPWGFAPFHYGRWAYFSSGWGWIPGPIAVRPVYAPALVAFVGGAGFSIAVSSGPAIGWFPLGPREVYVPPYSVSRNYFQRVNVSNTVINNTTIINNYYNNPTRVTQVNYVNRGKPNAVTAVPPAAFAQSQNVARAAVAVPAATIARAQVQQVARVAPARTAFLGAAPVARAKPPAAATQRTVVAKAPPPPAAVPDTQRIQALEKNPGRPLNRAEMQSLRAAAPAAAATAARPAVKLVEQGTPAARVAPPAAANAPQRGPATAESPRRPPQATARGPAERAAAEGAKATPPPTARPAPTPGGEAQADQQQRAEQARREAEQRNAPQTRAEQQRAAEAQARQQAEQRSAQSRAEQQRAAEAQARQQAEQRNAQTQQQREAQQRQQAEQRNAQQSRAEQQRAAEAQARQQAEQRNAQQSRAEQQREPQARQQQPQRPPEARGEQQRPQGRDEKGKGNDKKDQKDQKDQQKDQDGK